MAPAEWTHSIRAVRDTPVADYSAPRHNTTRCVAYRPPIAVSLYLLTLLVSYFEWTVWRCGQLWPYVGMGSLGTPLRRHSNAMCDVEIISPCIPSTCAQNAIFSLLIIHNIPSPHIYVAIDNRSLVLSVSCHTTSSALWNLMCATEDVSHAANLQCNGCRYFSYFYKFRDVILVSRVFRYCGERRR